MSELQPRMAEIRSKYKNDQQKQMEEIRKVQKEMGVNPIAGCLPLLVQMPVFLGLFHVLRSFNRTGTGSGQLGLSVEQVLVARRRDRRRRFRAAGWVAWSVAWCRSLSLIHTIVS